MTNANIDSAVAAIGRRGVQLAILAWLVVTLIPGAYLMAGHLIALPRPAGGPANPVLERAIAGLRRPGDRGRWLAVHVLLGTCGCSGKVLEHLIARGAGAAAAERVLLIEDEDAHASDADRMAKLGARGFAIESITGPQLASRFSIESAPLLIVMSPRDRLAYIGGYTDRKRSPAIHDTDILAGLARGESVEPLPIFGCAISKKLKRALDPLGLRN